MRLKLNVLTLIISIVIVLPCQSQIDTKWLTWKVNVSGIDSLTRADYLSRGLEKMDLALFSAYSVPGGEGYIISSMPNIDNIVSYVNNWNRGFTINSYEKVDLTDSLFLTIYLLRRNIAKENMLDQELPFIKLGPKRELSALLYNIALNEWSRQYHFENQ